MDDGETEMKKIEDSTQRQMAYSKRRKEIFKKAHELTVHCDAEVSIIIMCSSTKKLHEYTSPNSTMEKIIDQYQRRLGIDLWSTHYQKMQEKLRWLKDINNKIIRDIMQRTGEELNDLNMEQLCSLEEDMLGSLEKIRLRKYRTISIETDVCRKKVRHLESTQEHLLDESEMKREYPHGVVENEGDHGSAVAFANEISNLSARQHHSRVNFHIEGSFEHENSCYGSTVTMDAEDSL